MWDILGTFFMQKFCPLKNDISLPSTLSQYCAVTLSIPAWAMMPRCPEAQRKFGPVPASAFGQLGSHCSWNHAARRPQLPPALEALLSPLHNVTPLPLKPLENTSCSKPQWLQDAGYPPHSEPHRV